MKRNTSCLRNQYCVGDKRTNSEVLFGCNKFVWVKCLMCSRDTQKQLHTLWGGLEVDF